MSISTTQKPTTRRIVGMVVGIVIIGLGIALFKQSHLGNDSISALNMRLAELLGISLGVQNVATNILFFALEFWFGRKYIGLGTFVNGIWYGVHHNLLLRPHCRGLRPGSVPAGTAGVGSAGRPCDGAGRVSLPDG